MKFPRSFPGPLYGLWAAMTASTGNLWWMLPIPGMLAWESFLFATRAWHDTRRMTRTTKTPRLLCRCFHCRFVADDEC
jgi:hypothetical protein